MLRTKLDPDQKLSRVVSLKLTPPDHGAWLAKVESSGLTGSEFFRKAVLHNRTTVVEAPRVDGNLVAVLSLYAGLAVSADALITRASADRDKGTLGGPDYFQLLVGLSQVLGAFQAGFRNAG